MLGCVSVMDRQEKFEKDTTVNRREQEKNGLGIEPKTTFQGLKLENKNSQIAGERRIWLFL
jgi:hypothetical protein